MPSMGTVGDAYDNAMAESVFPSLEKELLKHRRFKSKTEARMAMFEWIEGWYNPHRRHSSIGRLSPTISRGEYWRTRNREISKTNRPRKRGNSRMAPRSSSLVRSMRSPGVQYALYQPTDRAATMFYVAAIEALTVPNAGLRTYV